MQYYTLLKSGTYILSDTAVKYSGRKATILNGTIYNTNGDITYIAQINIPDATDIELTAIMEEESGDEPIEG